MGRIIGKRYEIQHELGAGGMGTVFFGLDGQSGQGVAIKQLKREVAQPEMIERFIREGQALRELNHPNIVKLLDALEVDGQHYLVMEYVAGGDLRQLLLNGKLPYQRCLNIAIDLADALTRAHRLNIIHRDLKPANVLIAEDGTIRLTDFGVAHVVDKERVTETDAIVGTLDYLAPEVLNGEAVEPRSDIWAFGVMLFEMLAGQRPFAGQGYLQTLQAIASAPIPDLEALAPDAPIALVDLVYRSLCRDVQARISSVRHLGAELEDILHGRGNPAVTKRFETPIPDFRSRPKHNLPAQTTPFVGRENELTELARLIQNPAIRLVSIIAQGGMGKTRLSLEVAERAIPHFEHGVYFVELAPLNESSSIIPAIAQALSYQFQNDGREQLQQVCDFLYEKDSLVVLDNFEHLLDGASVVGDLLKAAPKLKILVTSRQRLDQSGESVFHLSGMDFPNWETPADALEYAAVKLFMNSAMRAKPDFELRADNLDAVARICKLVQGMPLGIVLAASWLGMLSPEEVASELQKGLDFLETDSQQIPERQRSMRAVMDYSWWQMSEAEQAVFAKLSVFRGGFCREAAEAVAGANLRILLSLVNKSLLYRDSATGRYEIHELLRQYAEEKGDIKANQDAHSRYFAEWMKAREVDLKGNRDLEAVKEIRADYENVKAAWFRAIEQEETEQVEKMLEALIPYSEFSGSQRIIRELVSHALKLSKDEILYAKIFVAHSQINWASVSNIDLMREGLKMAREKLDASWQGFVAGNLAMLLAEHRQDEEALALVDEALALLETSQEGALYARVNYSKAYVLFQRDDFASFRAAEPIIRKSYELWSALGNSWGKGFTLYNMGVWHNYNLEFELALKAYEERLPIAQANQNIYEICHSYLNLSNLQIRMGDYQTTLETAHKHMSLALDYQLQSMIPYAYVMLLDVLSVLGRFEEAHQYLEALREFATNPQLNSRWRRVSHEAFYLMQSYLALRQKSYPVVLESLHQYLNVDETDPASATLLYLNSGRAAIYLREFQTARENLLKALPYTFDVEASLHALFGLAELEAVNGEKSTAVEYAALVFEHRGTYFEYRQYAKELLAELQSEMDSEEYQSAYERGKLLDLETLVNEILAGQSQ